MFLSGAERTSVISKHLLINFACVHVCVNRLRSMLDKGGAVKKFVDALQQLTNPEMIFKVRSCKFNHELIKRPPTGFCCH